jgi:Integrase core domain
VQSRPAATILIEHLPAIECDFPTSRKSRDEFPERLEFETVADARVKGSWFRREYKAVRPHSSLGYATPKEFSAACDERGIHRQIE